MGQVIALVDDGLMLADAQRAGRALRVSWHHEAGVVVLSLWQAETCIGSFRLEPALVPALVKALVDGLAAQVPDPAAGQLPAQPPGDITVAAGPTDPTGPLSATP